MLHEITRIDEGFQGRGSRMEGAPPHIYDGEGMASMAWIDV